MKNKSVGAAREQPAARKILPNGRFLEPVQQASPVHSLPPRQHDVLNLIVSLSDQQGYPPTLAELAQAMGLRNRMTVRQHVSALKHKGLVNWEAGLNRSLTLTQRARVQLSLDTHPYRQMPQSGLPLSGTIAAGCPIDALETDERLEIDSNYAGCFALKVKGDSMIEDGICDGDYVIVKPSPSPHNGEIVVALLPDNTATLKRFYKKQDGIVLEPANSTMKSIEISKNQELKIQGTVVGLFRKF